MAIDIQRMKPSQICRTVNSTPLGTVLNERQLYRYRTEAGLRIGDGTHVDLLKFTAWLIEKRHAPKPPVDDDPYAKVKEKAGGDTVLTIIYQCDDCSDCSMTSQCRKNVDAKTGRKVHTTNTS